MTHGRAFAAAVLLLALAACSATRMVYNRLDWLAGWEIDKYAELKPEQEAAFERDFGALWEWHRRNELPQYARDLRVLAKVAQQPIDAAQAQEIALAWSGWWQRSLERLSPELCALLATLDERQVQSALEQLDEGIEQDAREYDLPEAKLRRRSNERIEKNLRRWLGPLEESQREYLAQWGAQRTLTHDLWLENRRRWRARFEDALATRAQDGFCERLQPLLLRQVAPEDEARRARLEAGRADWMRLVVELSQQLTPRQREHFAKELNRTADELDALAREREKKAD